MDILESKYIADNLTNEQLAELRDKINSLSYKEISDLVEDSWNNYDGAGVSAPESCYKKINQFIDNDPTQQHKSNILKRITQIAAAVLVPLLIITSAYFYKESRELTTQTMTISTGIGEKANVTLPDGTIVIINTESTLSYIPNIFNKNERRIKFEGEAYFNVKKQTKSPFIIQTTDVNVEVLGTIFNLCSREKNTTVELDLEQGSVLFSATKNNKNFKLSPNQTIVFNRLTGEMTVTDQDNTKISPWQHSELIFRNATLNEVLTVIETSYSVKIDIKGDIKAAKDLFTGTIPDNNLIEALEAIETSYHIKSKIINREVSLTQQ